MSDKTIILDGFSKTYAMTGWRLGEIATLRGSQDAVDRMEAGFMRSTPFANVKGRTEFAGYCGRTAE